MRYRNWLGALLAVLGLFTGSAFANDYFSTADGDPVVADSSCDSCYCEECCCKPALLGVIKPTDTAWSGFISPMSNPVFFEDPRTLTEARFIFAHHNLPPLAGGAIPASDIQVLALQLRAALTDDLSIIATKDGFFFASPDAPLDDGWLDLSLGLKYNLWKDCECQRILSVGGTFELPTGSRRALQGNGDGEFNMFASYGAQIGDCNHFITTAGLRLPANSNAENEVFYWAAHLDRQIAGTNLYGFVEGNWYHWLGNGNVAAFNGIQGLDFFNFGSTGVAGSNIVTGAVGVKWTPTLLQEVGVAYEGPLTNTQGVIQNRLIVNYILRY